MSRRGQAGPPPAAPTPAEPAREPSGRTRTLALQAALLIAVFGAGTGLALLAGAANAGVALGIGQIAFAIVLVWLLLRR